MGSSVLRAVGGKGGAYLAGGVAGVSAAANTGSGGAGADSNAVGGFGGSGIVIIRYPLGNV